MSINANPFNCDICTRAKQETNHWLLGIAVTDGFKVILWEVQMSLTGTVAHLCGLECASKWIMKKLSELQQIPSPSLGATEEKP